MNVKKCERCKKPTNNTTIMSMFNTQVICMPCKEEEKENPRYMEAVEADRKAIVKGDYNFKGIGLV
jgi:predicted sulfurtransferase